MNADERPRRRAGGFGFPLVLIAIGVAALAGTLGLTPISWVNILALWPLLLVIAGIDLLLAHRSPLGALALDLVVVGVGLVLLITRPLGSPVFPFVSFGGNDCPSGSAAATVSAPRGSTDRLSLHVTGGAATYTITGGATDLVNARSDAADLYLRASGTDVRITQCGFFAGGTRDVEVRIASDVPTSLDLTGGAATFNVDLRDVKLTDARFTNGAATTDLKLPKPSGDVSIRLTGGASTIDIDLGGAEASVDVSGGLTSLNAPNGGGGSTFGGRTHWDSPGYAAAKDRYTITVTGGASTVNVR